MSLTYKVGREVWIFIKEGETKPNDRTCVRGVISPHPLIAGYDYIVEIKEQDINRFRGARDYVTAFDNMFNTHVVCVKHERCLAPRAPRLSKEAKKAFGDILDNI